MELLSSRCVAILLTLGLSGCTTAAAPLTLQQRCAAVPAHDLVEIKSYEQDLISACPPDADKGCIYNLTTGQTYSTGTPDLNADGLPDQIAKHFGSNYGDIDVVDYLGFVQCGDGTSIKVIDGVFKTLTLPGSFKTAWPDLDATRECATPGKDSTPVQHLKLVFNQKTYVYEEIPKVDPGSVCTHN